MFARLMGLDTLSPAALYELMQQAQVTVIDVNSHQSWAKARVPGARNLDPTTYAESELPADKGTNLVFYCSNPLCRKAPTAGRRAKKMGYRNIQVMSAGISGWLGAKLPTDSGLSIVPDAAG